MYNLDKFHFYLRYLSLYSFFFYNMINLSFHFQVRSCVRCMGCLLLGRTCLHLMESDG